MLTFNVEKLHLSDLMSCHRVIKPGGVLVTLIFPVSSEMDANTGPPWPVTPEMYQEYFTAAGFQLEEISPVPPELSHKGREGRELLGKWRRRQ